MTTSRSSSVSICREDPDRDHGPELAVDLDPVPNVEWPVRATAGRSSRCLRLCWIARPAIKENTASDASTR